MHGVTEISKHEQEQELREEDVEKIFEEELEAAAPSENEDENKEFLGGACK